MVWPTGIDKEINGLVTTFECPNCKVEMKMLGATVAWCPDCGTAIQTVLNLRHNPKQLDLMQNALRSIIRIEGCECDDYNGHKCVLCRIREIARNVII